MKIAVIGAGAIGALVAGYLKQEGVDVSLVGRAPGVAAIREKGLRVRGVRGEFNIKIDAAEKLNFTPDLAILATKTQDLAVALNENIEFLKSAALLTTQNGMQAESIAAQYTPPGKVISSIVMFGATTLNPGEVVHNFEGSWIMGKFSGAADEQTKEWAEVLNKAFPTIVSEDIQEMKYLKLFVNANNCIPAILGQSMQEAFSDPRVSCVSMAIWREGLSIVDKAGIKLKSLPDFPLERLMKLTSLPLEAAAKIYAGIMVSLSKEPVYGSILQSIKRGRTSEIDYINGEFVLLAEKNHLIAPLNKKMVEMVHEVERTNQFFTKETLLARTKGLLN